jgi:hypothetical protein
MTEVPVYIDLNQYFSTLSLKGYPMEKRGLIMSGVAFAQNVLEEIYRRDMLKAIGHSLAVAKGVADDGLSPESQTIAVCHDVKEDGKIRKVEILLPDEELFRPVTNEDILGHFGPEYGDEMVYGIDSLTIHRGNSRKDYYNWFAKDVIPKKPEMLIIRLRDRENFHRYPFNGEKAKEIAKCEDSLGDFCQMTEDSILLLPDYLKSKAEDIHHAIQILAKRQLDGLLHPRTTYQVT